MTHEEIQINALTEFISKFRASLDPRVWLKLIDEESNELEAELDGGDKERILKELCDLRYVTIGFNLVSTGAEQLNLFGADEHEEIMRDLTYAQGIYNVAIEKLGDIPYLDAFRRVHNSNMSKLGEDGKPVYREDGKVLKGPNYKEPNMKGLVT